MMINPLCLNHLQVFCAYVYAFAFVLSGLVLCPPAVFLLRSLSLATCYLLHQLLEWKLSLTLALTRGSLTLVLAERLLDKKCWLTNENICEGRIICITLFAICSELIPCRWNGTLSDRVPSDNPFNLIAIHTLKNQKLSANILIVFFMAIRTALFTFTITLSTALCVDYI